MISVDAVLIIGLTAAVLGVMMVVLLGIGVVVLGPAVRRSLAERRATHEASAESVKHGDGGG